MHRMTRTATAHPASPPVHDPSLVLADITHPEQMEQQTISGNISPVEDKAELLQQSKYPALNQMLGLSS